MLDHEITDNSLEKVPSLTMKDIVPDLQKYREWEAKIIELEVIGERKSRQATVSDLFTMIQTESDSVLRDGFGLDDLDQEGPGRKSFVGTSNGLIKSIKAYIRKSGKVDSYEARLELCAGVDRLIAGFFKKKMKARHSGFRSVQSRNRRVRTAAKMAQARIGMHIDENYDFAPSVEHHLHPYEVKSIEVGEGDFYSSLKRIKAAYDLIEQEERLYDVILIIDDLFDRPWAYPEFYISLGGDGNMNQLRALYSYAMAMVEFRDGGAEAQIWKLSDEFVKKIEAEMEADQYRTHVAVWTGEAMHDDFGLKYDQVLEDPLPKLEPLLTPWVDTKTLGIEMPWATPEPVVDEVSAAVEEVLDETPSHPITMKDMARLLRMMVWERDTLTSRMVTNMNHRGTREGDWKWKAEHFKVPEELRTFMKAVYEHPRTKGGIRYIQFYMALWLENYIHWFEDQFHPEVCAALKSGAIDSGLTMNDEWVDDEAPKSGFSDSNLMAIEADLPWPQ